MHISCGSRVGEMPVDSWLDMPIAVRDAVQRRVVREGIVADALVVTEEDAVAGAVPGMGIRVTAPNWALLVGRIEREVRRILGYTEEEPVVIYLRFSSDRDDFNQAWEYFYNEEGEGE